MELNADTTIKDVRGQTALDLARLWGHRMCAKYLSDDLWHVTKKVLAEQIEIERKMQAQSILKEVESAHYVQFEDEDESAKNFEEWLKHQGFLSETTDYDNLLSHRSQIHNQSLKESIDNKPEQKSPKSIKKAIKKPSLHKINKLEKDWNHSTKATGSDYVPNLEDYYPRDPYTFLPKNLDLILVNKELRGMSLEQVKEFMKLNLGRVDSASENYDSNRPVYYKPKNVIDSQTKQQRSDNDRLKDEAWMNMCNDVRSFQFQEARNYVIDSYNTQKAQKKSKDSIYGGFYNTKGALKQIKNQLKPSPKDDKLEIIEKLYGEELSNFMKDPRHGKMSQKYEKVFIC